MSLFTSPAVVVFFFFFAAAAAVIHRLLSAEANCLVNYDNNNHSRAVFGALDSAIESKLQLIS